MATRQAMCITHTDQPAAARCRSCQKPLCQQCILEKGGEKFCSEECAAKAQAYRARDKPGELKSGGGLLKPIIVIVIIAAAIFVGGKVLHIGPLEKVLKLIGLG